MDRLATTTRLGVGLFGVVGTHAQLFRWVEGTETEDARLRCGAATLLSSCAVGMLLLSSFGESKSSRMLWRLHADAPAAERFNLAEKVGEVERIGQSASITSDSGLIPGAQMTAVLFPQDVSDGPLALGVLHSAHAKVDCAALTATLHHTVQQCLNGGVEDSHPPVRRFAIA
jgi:DNA-binding IclR family transcriptional regulator